MVTILSKDIQRLGTFAAYPKTCPLYSTRLSSAGFIYTGKGDVVTCTECHVEIGNWNKKDIPVKVHQEHSPKCPMVLLLLGKNECKTEKLQDIMENNATTKDINLGQQHNCTSKIESSKSESYDTTDSGSSFSSINMDGREGENVTPSPESGSFILKSPSMIPYKNPRYPNMSILCERLQTFNKRPRNFKQLPENLARAGFFYTGVDDLVRCFHCGGGLTHWEPEDNPWVEHAHWFPKCVFLRQNKGDEFIGIVQGMVEQQEQQQVNTSDAFPRKQDNTELEQTGATGNSRDMIVTDQEKHRNRDATTELKDLIAVKSVQEMGYNLDIIIPAYHKVVAQQKTNKVSAVQLMEKVFEMEEQQVANNSDRIPESVPITETTDQNNKESKQPVSESHTVDMTTPLSINETEPAFEEQNTTCVQSETETGDLKGAACGSLADIDILLCKVCMEEQVSIVFLPCGHLATCGQCAPAMKKCPICRQHVRGTVKTYLS